MILFGFELDEEAVALTHDIRAGACQINGPAVYVEATLPQKGLVEAVAMVCSMAWPGLGPSRRGSLLRPHLQAERFSRPHDSGEYEDSTSVVRYCGVKIGAWITQVPSMAAGVHTDGAVQLTPGAGR
ncbi:hypothetical protein NEUTE2DRAFT_129739 [Neurospora tetrasperma FGSC 2509]|nr:hypothetical protein NEUTE2DRAFT_129739 [Neurospora tetrasperma FGSC 2509]